MRLSILDVKCLAEEIGSGGALYKTGIFSGVHTLAGYADTSKHGRERFVISLRSNDGAIRYRLLKAIQSGL